MAFKRPERVAEEYVRENIQASIEPFDLSTTNLNVAIAQMDERMQVIIKDVQNEIECDEAAELMFTKYEALKYRFITMFLSGHYSRKQIANTLGVSQQTIERWLKKEDIVTAIRDYQEKESFVIDATMKALRTKALERAAELLDGDNEMVQAIMIRDILDRTGHKPVEKKQVDVTMTYEERLRALANVEYEVINDTSANAQINTEGEAK